jgi:hypothetical protein
LIDCLIICVKNKLFGSISEPYELMHQPNNFVLNGVKFWQATIITYPWFQARGQDSVNRETALLPCSLSVGSICAKGRIIRGVTYSKGLADSSAIYYT